MAIRDDFAPGEVLRAEDLNDTFASKLPYEFGDTEPTTTVDGFLWYDDNETPPAPKFWDGSAFQALTSGKILQVVRATDSTERSTTSESFVDANISVTLTPQKSDSAVLLVWSSVIQYQRTAAFGGIRQQITDNSNNAISGAELTRAEALFSASGATSMRIIEPHVMIAYATPATTSSVTYKGRFRVESSALSGVAFLLNSINTGQMYAIEVSA